MDMLERSPLPLAAEPSSARDRYGICVCRLPFISVFGNCISFYTAAPPKLASGSYPVAPLLCFVVPGYQLREVAAYETAQTVVGQT